MTYDGGIRVAKYEDYELPFTAPWAIGMGEEHVMPDRGVEHIDSLRTIFALYAVICQTQPMPRGLR